MLISFANVLQSSEGHSFAKFKAQSSEKFNPFLITKALGTTTESHYAGSSFFFGDPDDSLWGGSGNASGAPDGLSANTFVFPNKKSRYLLLKDFDFNIPCNAVVTDIAFNVTRRNNSTVDATDVEVRIFNPVTLNFSVLNNADPGPWIEGGAYETIVYSDATWGETFSPEILNDPRFGLVISVANLEPTGRSDAQIDAVEMVVCYDVDTPVTTPISITTAKIDACFDQGSITVTASGGTGAYEYSNDAGMTWQASNVFDGLSFGDYIVTVRSADGTCQTANFYCNVSGDDRILQAGDMVVACSTYPGSRVTLAVEKTQLFNDFYNDGLVGADVSQFLPVHPYEWTVSDLGGEVFSFSIDQNRNIYTAVTTLYDLVPGAMISPRVSKIDAFTGDVTQYNTLPGRVGAAGVEYDTLCNNLYIANLDDGMIYRMDPDNGAILSSFDPLGADDGVAGYAPLGERVIAVTYNYSDGRLYYSVWHSDFNMSGVKNTIRSVAIDPATCDFLPATDQLELEQPWLTEYGDPTATSNYNMPVSDIVFSDDGSIMLLSEVGFDSDGPASKPHESRILQYNGSSFNWTLSTNIPADNTNLQHEVGEVSDGLNARGGIDFANSGFDADKCAIEDEQFIVATADALRGANCNTFGCIYGLQYLPLAGGNSANSVILDIGRDFSSQLKSVFGDVDVVRGCQESVFCCPSITGTPMDKTICPGAVASTVTATTETDSLALVYHTTLPADSMAIYADGIKIDIEATVGGSATLDLSNLPTTAGTYYVYIVTHPTPAGAYCRPNLPFVVTVATPTTLELTGASLVCVDDDIVNFTGTPAPAGMAMGAFSTTATAGLSDNGDGTADFDPTTAGAGIYDVTYTYTDPDGCLSSITNSIEVDPCFDYDLSLAKTVTSTGPYMPGSKVSYDIVITNEGDLEGINIEVSDTPPSGLTLVSSSAATNPNITETTPGNYTIASVPVSGSETISLTYTIDMDFMGTSLLNIAQITSDNGDDIDSDPNTSYDTDDLGDGVEDDDEGRADVTIDLNYDLAVSKTVVTAGPYRAGDNITFDIIVSNEGTVDANNIEISELPNTGLFYLNSSFSNNVTEGAQGIWTVLSLTANATETITVTYQVEPNFTGTSVINNVRITADDGTDIDSDPDVGPEADDYSDGIADDDEDEVAIDIEQIYDLSLVKTVTSNGPYEPGDMVTYAIVVSNDGTLPASNIEFRDTATPTLLFQSDDSGMNANITSLGGGLYQIGALAAGSTETINLIFQIDPLYAGGPVANVGQITADDGDDTDSDPDSGTDQDDNDDGIPDDDEDEGIIDVLINGSIGDFVFEDTNGNGIQDFNETGFPNVRVNLYNVNGFIVDFQFTNASGNYLFGDVPAGNYYIEIVYPDGYANTFFNQGGDDTIDSDVDNSNGPGTTPIINLGPGENDLSIDIGINECILVGELVWFDYNENDVIDTFENGINGIRVELYRQDSNGAFVLWDVTHTGHKPGSPSDDGYYKFCVSPGSYYVRFVNPPLQLVPVVPNFGNNENTDSDVTGMFGSGTTDNFTVVSGDERCDIGAGFYAMGSIGDYVWLDNNGNGMRDSNDQGMEGIVVRAINDNGDEVASAISDENGKYVLDYLTKSTMYLEFDSPDGYSFTQAHIGFDDRIDSDVDNSNGENTTDYFTINPGIHVPNIDAGLMSRVLSIDWSSVSGEYKQNHNLVKWSIQSDVDISHFTIERSFDNIEDFVEIGKVLSDTQEGESISNYDYKDYDIIEPGFYYYRILQTDINGEEEYSKVISIEVSNVLSDKVEMYPNPVVEELLIAVDMDREVANFGIELYDRLGQLVKSNLLKAQNLRAGKNQFNVNVTDIPDGMYNVKINIDNEILFKKLIVLKQ